MKDDSVKKFFKKGGRGRFERAEEPTIYYLMEKMCNDENVIQSGMSRLPLDKQCELYNMMVKGISGPHSTYRVIDNYEYKEIKKKYESVLKR